MSLADFSYAWFCLQQSVMVMSIMFLHGALLKPGRIMQI